MVTVQGLGGDMLEQEMSQSESIGNLRQYISAAWELDAAGFKIISTDSGVLLDDAADIKSLVPSDGGLASVQVVKFDPLPKLGQFDIGKHNGIEVIDNGKTLRKTSSRPDSNNVFLKHEIHEPCFVEFIISRMGDEMSLGVTYQPRVEELSGFSNLGSSDTWIYSRTKSMPPLFLGGKRLSGVPGLQQGDRITVYVDPDERLLEFHRNGSFVASNLPDNPLPEKGDRPLRMYVMLDETGDEVSVSRFGPGHLHVQQSEPAPAPAPAHMSVGGIPEAAPRGAQRCELS